MTSSSDWLYWLSSLIIGLCGLTLLIWALFADRARGRRRCPKCWYDMSGTEGMRCSECGKTAKHASKLLKTRRRWRWAAVSVVMVLTAGYLGVQPQVRENGWASLVPNTLLIAGLYTEKPNWAMEALQKRQRYVESPFWTWQWRLIASRCTELLSRQSASPRTRADAMMFLRYAAETLRDTTDVTPIFDTVEQYANEGGFSSKSAVVLLADDPVQSRAIERVRRFIDHPDADAREGAAIAIWMLIGKSDEALPLAFELAAHPDPLFRNSAMTGLWFYAQRGGQAHEVVDIVRQACFDPKIRCMAFRALLAFSHSTDEAFEYVCSRFDSEDAAERIDALWALMGIRSDHPRTMDILLAALRDPSPDVRREACDYLDRMKYWPLENLHFRALRLQLQSIATETAYEEVRKAISALGLPAMEDQ